LVALAAPVPFFSARDAAQIVGQFADQIPFGGEAFGGDWDEQAPKGGQKLSFGGGPGGEERNRTNASKIMAP
jgi:hypothetical protein